MMSKTNVLLALLLSVVGLTAQTVIPVAGGGAALATAVAVAPDGAVLVVAPGTYLPFQAWRRQLTIVAPQRAQIACQAYASGAFLVTMTGIGPARPIRLIGFDLVQGSIATPPGYVRGKIDCADAHLEACTCQGIRSLGGLVVVDRTTVVAPDNAGIAANQGTLVLTDSTFVGGSAGAPFQPLHALPGVWVGAGILRAERIQAQAGAIGIGAPAVELVDQGGVSCVATIADSVLTPSPSSASPSIACTPGTTLVSSGNQLPGGVGCTPGIGSLATLRWLQRQWTPGGTSSLRCHELPGTLAAAVVSFTFVPFPTPLTAELAFVGATPDWFVWTLGITNAAGDFDFTLPLPNTAGASYASLWLTGLAGAALPFHATVPLGGVVW